MGRVREEKRRRKKLKKRKSQKKEDPGARKGRKVAKHCVFPMICGSGGFQVKMYKTPQRRSTFRSCDVEKVHAVVARSTFRSQKCKKLTGSDHFCVFAIFPVHLSKVLRLPRKRDARSYEVLHLSRKIISANLKI